MLPLGARAEDRHSRACPGCRCKTCGEYIYKGKKFNARKETVQNEAYLGLPIFRFYIKCTRCLAEITFKVGASFIRFPSVNTPQKGRVLGRCLQQNHTQKSLPTCMCARYGICCGVRKKSCCSGPCLLLCFDSVL